MGTTLTTQVPRNKGTAVADGAAPAPLAPDLLRKIDAYWRAANYVSVGQIYLYDNPLLREPLKLEHVKPRYGEDMPEIRNWKWTETRR